MRSPTWISPPFAGATSTQFQTKHEVSNPLQTTERRHEQFSFTKEEKERFKNDPEFHLQFRKNIEAELNMLTDMFILGSPIQEQVHKMMIEQMKQRIGPGNEELKSRLIPKWAPGCRRITPGDQYLETLIQPHVEPVFGEIKHLTNTSIVMENGTDHAIDVLVGIKSVSQTGKAK